MTSKLYLFFVAILFSFVTLAYADEASLDVEPRSAIQIDRTNVNSISRVSKGWRIGYIFSGNYDMDTSAKDLNGSTDSLKTELDHDFGYSLSFTDIPIHKFGYEAGVTHTRYTSDLASYRGEASVTWGFNDFAYVFSGFNLHKFRKNKLKQMNPAVGFQMGGGVHLNKTFALILKYVIVENEGTVSFGDNNSARVNTELDGIEIGLNIGL